MVVSDHTDRSRDCITRNQCSQTLCCHKSILDGIRIVRFGGMVEQVTTDKRWVSKNNRSKVKVITRQ